MSFTPSPYKVSTITATGSIGCGIDLEKIFDVLQIEQEEDKEGFLYIESGKKRSTTYSKGYHKKLSKKKNSTSIRRFDNQTTLVCRVFDKELNSNIIINCKVFRNGNIQMTGLKYLDQGKNILRFLINNLPTELLEKDKNDLEPINYKIRLINGDFRTGCEIRRDKLCKLIQSTSDIFCNYEPCIYPGVKIQYNYNTLTKDKADGLCYCKDFCNGKGCGEGDGKCKRVTISVFQSGCIIITGGQSNEQVNAAYVWICDTLNRHSSCLDKFTNKT